MAPQPHKPDVRGELESIGRCLKGEELVKALMERVVAAEEEKATLAGKVEELSRVQKEAGTLRKQNEILTKKMETLESVLMKTELAKGKLESLCREMQKAQKKAHDEHVEKLKALEKSRKEMIDQFKESVATIQKSMETGRETSERLTTDNANLSEKLKSLANEYESRVALLSKQFAEKTEYCEKLTAARDMEVELYKTKLVAANLDIQKCSQEKLQLKNELLARELRMKEALEGEKAMREQIDKYTKKYNELHNSLNTSNETFEKFKREMERLLARELRMKEALEGEKAMREQIDKYTKKYNELHNSLNTSNETFEKFKREMERMNGNLIKVEKECRKWKTKYDETAQALAAATVQKKESEDACALKERQLQQLQGLCRTLKAQISNQ
ncbi:Alpha-taxilin [Toxocara canis]|uniref:Alpha-taxilin n=1 Tax=Toxocara canis TaxID=6265 RepID=A0A0B2V8J8_TOXCA|nr:Alpha-taxilin [Toxocara canis]